MWREIQGECGHQVINYLFHSIHDIAPLSIDRYSGEQSTSSLSCAISLLITLT